MKKRAITLTINGEEYNLNIPVHYTLLQVIRDQLNLTDVKYGCGRGECGACTVLLVEEGGTKCKTVDAHTPTAPSKRQTEAHSCLYSTGCHHGRQKHITTVAGLAKDGDAAPRPEGLCR